MPHGRTDRESRRCKRSGCSSDAARRRCANTGRDKRYSPMSAFGSSAAVWGRRAAGLKVLMIVTISFVGALFLAIAVTWKVLSPSASPATWNENASPGPEVTTLKPEVGTTFAGPLATTLMLAARTSLVPETVARQPSFTTSTLRLGSARPHGHVAGHTAGRGLLQPVRRPPATRT